jgi:hypothetical protein
VFLLHVVDHCIFGSKRPQDSKHHLDNVRGEICLKEIVLNTSLDHAFIWTMSSFNDLI